MIRVFALAASLLTVTAPASAQLVRSESGPATGVCLVVNAVDGRQACVPARTIIGSGSLSTGQVSIGTTATPVVAARSGRQRVILTPSSSAIYYVGGSGVTAATGIYIAAGGSVTLDTSAAIYAVGAAGFTLTYAEMF